MEEISIVGLDLAKRVFQVHGAACEAAFPHVVCTFVMKKILR